MFREFGLSISEEMYKQFDCYAEKLVEWNEKINLTAITDAQGITEKHFLDSLAAFRIDVIPQNASVIDVGTGAGFPGIPMKIYRNDLNVTLLDSLNKRVKFLSEISDSLSLGMNCIHSRAEDGAKKTEFREKFDIATARAVAPLPVLCEYCLPYVKVGGSFVALKGPNENAKDSFTAYRTLGAEIDEIAEYQLPCGDKRQIIIYKKVKETPAKYPRNPSQIDKKPL
ncbi:MAG: 16S rRNA (guanine(527)-N(7))-methyltransferase RsmG [Oscillospiraceae bacterium]